MKKKLVTVFEAEDGREFTDPFACRRHERIQAVQNLIYDLCVSESGRENDEARHQVATMIVDRWAGLTIIMSADRSIDI